MKIRMKLYYQEKLVISSLADDDERYIQPIRDSIKLIKKEIGVTEVNGSVETNLKSEVGLKKCQFKVCKV